MQSASTTVGPGQQPNQPLRSSRGGYLRSPFTLNPAFETVVAKYAVRGDENNRERLAAARELDRDDEGTGRPWIRAGVGAKLMSAKERRQQQAEAERIYGPSSSLESEVNDQPHDPSAAVWGAPLPALSSWERSALRHAVPRGVRRSGDKVRGSDDTVSVAACPDDVADQNLLKGINQPRPPSAGIKRKGGEDVNPSSTRARHHYESDGHQKSQSDCGEVTNIPPLHAKKPLNKLQILDQMRDAALFGKQRKRRGMMTA